MNDAEPLAHDPTVPADRLRDDLGARCRPDVPGAPFETGLLTQTTTSRDLGPELRRCQATSKWTVWISPLPTREVRLNGLPATASYVLQRELSATHRIAASTFDERLFATTVRKTPDEDGANVPDERSFSNENGTVK